MEKNHYGKLSGMMFLQYAVWGAWLPILSTYLGAPKDKGGLGFDGGQIGMILGLAGSVGAVTSPFIGQIADRMFSTERCLAFLLLAGGVLKYYTAYQETYEAWLFLSVVYSVLYMPTISLSNSMAFANSKDPDKSFPFIRVWGTIGWIAASWIFPMVFLQTGLKPTLMPPFLVGEEYPDVTARLVNALKLSGGISIAYAVYCLFLPHTPPKKDAVESIAVAKAFGLFRKPSFALLVLASLPISIIHQIYFMQTGPFLKHIGFLESQISPVMTIGQFFEIAVMAALGLMLKRLGFRWVITIGGLCYFLRYAICGTPGIPKELIALSLVLHGFCFSCFFAAGFIYVDRIAPVDIRHSAQTVFGIIILGLGPVAGGRLAGILSKAFTTPGLDGASGVLDYQKFWYVCAAIGGATTLLIAALFRDESQGGEKGLSKGEADELSEVM